MSSQRAVHQQGSSLWTAARLLAALVGFAALLFLTRYLLRGHLVMLMDQECHIGGIAVEVLTHGIRFPLVAYSPNEYDNSSFYSGLLTAGSFALLGRNLLALKLVTHVICAAGAVAALWLLRRCLTELGLTSRRARWAATAALVIAIALAPRVVTMFSMYAAGNHAEGCAIGTMLLALFSRRLHAGSNARTAAFWALVGFALYVNKGTALVIPVLAIAELLLARGSLGRIAAACGGFFVGILPEVLVIAQQYTSGWGILGWTTMLSKERRNSQAFPGPFLDTLWFLAEYRIELVALWAITIGTGTALLLRAAARSRRQRTAQRQQPEGDHLEVPVTLGVVVGVSWLHLLALSVMAKNGLDVYVIYGYPALTVLYGVLIAAVVTRAAGGWSEAAATWTAVAAIAATFLFYRPYAVTWGSSTVAALWTNRAGAACAWRFAEGFRREYEFGLVAPGPTLEGHVIERCRSLSDQPQVLDCIGGIARELQWRQPDGQVHGEPPAELTADERRAYAYQYGTHRKGNVGPCSDFTNPDLTAMCAAAVELECLHYADNYTRLVSARDLARPSCPITEPPMEGFWTARRASLLARLDGMKPNLERAWGDDNLTACKPVFDACYGAGAARGG